MPTKKAAAKPAPKSKTIPLRLQHQYKICVSGAAAGETVQADAELAYEVGRQIALQGAVLLTGATTGLPFYAAKGNYECGGIAIGLSPAATIKEHVNAYKLPVAYHDVIIYTGFNYSGRNLLLTRAADAVITIGGRMGSLNEFTIAFEDQKTIGVLMGSGGIADEIPHLLHTAKKELSSRIIYSTEPKILVQKVIAAVHDEYNKAGYFNLKEIRRGGSKG
jgi:uncharacterized protein (TIGR00725 family)